MISRASLMQKRWLRVEVMRVFGNKMKPRNRTGNCAKAEDIWQHFGSAGKVFDIILPEKRDKWNNRIGFVKVENITSAELMVTKLKNERFIGSVLDMQIIKNDSNVAGNNLKISKGKENLESQKSQKIEQQEEDVF
ncbi:hypothetical protein POM88_008103 [Heracleum sosnowskyi]|uniref:RRM domain-containing protein n=1 Tax=Heracleum sosnowskyi TaxID=360622 RepID=A0AAD8J5L1_9APIA|nr:hypothetical protein POM88_008103 [Heracleum sosnowskyi]